MSDVKLPPGMPSEYDASIAVINRICEIGGHGEGEDFDSEEVRAVGIKVARDRDAAWAAHVAELEAALQRRIRECDELYAERDQLRVQLAEARATIAKALRKLEVWSEERNDVRVLAVLEILREPTP